MNEEHPTESKTTDMDRALVASRGRYRDLHPGHKAYANPGSHTSPLVAPSSLSGVKREDNYSNSESEPRDLGDMGGVIPREPTGSPIHLLPRMRWELVPWMKAVPLVLSMLVPQAVSVLQKQWSKSI